jgi:hypothetical protein
VEPGELSRHSDRLRDGGERLASRPDCFIPGTRWVGPTACLDNVEQRKISCLCRESNPERPARRPPLYRLLYSLGNYKNIHSTHIKLMAELLIIY